MRTTFIATGLVTAGIFGAGYVVGEISGVLPTYAASSGRTATPGARDTGNPHHWGNRNAGPHADGTVTAIHGDSFSVKADTDVSGSAEYTRVTTINVTSATQYVADHSAATKAAVTVGSHISAEGTVSVDGTTLTATSVRVGDGPAGRHGAHFGHFDGFRPHADGTVTALSGDTISITPDADHGGRTPESGVSSVLVSASTTYSADRGGAATRASIKPGSHVFAVGTLSADGKTLNASHVIVLTDTWHDAPPNGAVE